MDTYIARNKAKDQHWYKLTIIDTKKYREAEKEHISDEYSLFW